MVEGSRASTERFQMAVGTEAAGAFQSPGRGAAGGKLAGSRVLSPDISPNPPPQPHSISRLPRKLQEAWGRRRTMPVWVSAGPLLAGAA